jgi:hypothetical protein
MLCAVTDGLPPVFRQTGPPRCACQCRGIVRRGIIRCRQGLSQPSDAAANLQPAGINTHKRIKARHTTS